MTESEIFWNIFLGVVTTVLCSVAVLVFKKVTGFEYFRYMKSTHRIRQAGVVTFFPNRFILQKDVGPIGDYIEKAKNSVKYVGLYLSGALTHQGIRDSIQKQVALDVTFTFCVVSPDTPHLAAYANYLGITEEELKTHLDNTVRALGEIRASLPEEYRQNIKIKVHDEMITTSFWVFDENHPGSLIQLDHKVKSATRMNSYGFEIMYKKHKKPHVNEFYTMMLNRYNAILRASREVQ